MKEVDRFLKRELNKEPCGDCGLTHIDKENCEDTRKRVVDDIYNKSSDKRRLAYAKVGMRAFRDSVTGRDKDRPDGELAKQFRKHLRENKSK